MYKKANVCIQLITSPSLIELLIKWVILLFSYICFNTHKGGYARCSEKRTNPSCFTTIPHKFGKWKSYEGALLNWTPF